jgi:hypothetical protein
MVRLVDVVHISRIRSFGLRSFRSHSACPPLGTDAQKSLMNGVTGVYGYHDTIAGVIPWKCSRFCEQIVSCFPLILHRPHRTEKISEIDTDCEVVGRAGFASISSLVSGPFGVHDHIFVLSNAFTRGGG